MVKGGGHQNGVTFDIFIGDLISNSIIRMAINQVDILFDRWVEVSV